jgi:sucrose-6F-phosphate phosphohydrolase
MSRYLICSDLDRTILPNGKEPHSPEAMPIFKQLADREETTIVYVSGRNEKLLKEAIKEYNLPLPDYAIGDVGTTIYEPPQNWHPWEDWAREIGQDWKERTRTDLEDLFTDLDGLKLQEQEKQNTYKLSYYADADIDGTQLKKEIEKRLVPANVQASIIWSVDEEKNVGLVDILPERATKVHAVRFLIEKRGFPDKNCVFAGDSGNDLPALTSGLNAVLVKNSRDDVRQEAIETLDKKAMREHLYQARGDFLGMNGNYCAGVLEGVAHFLPETLQWMKIG